MATLSSADIKEQARLHGFDLCGVAAAESYPELGFLEDWLARGFAGEMHYLARSAALRADVRAVMPHAQSVVVLGTLYNTDAPYSASSEDPARAHIARYAWGDDYHVIIERRLSSLVAWMSSRAPDCEARPYVDTGPLQERVYAARAGLGWIGKNTCLINDEKGSWLFLSAIVVNLKLEPDRTVTDRCGTCTRCLEACPTGALVEPYVLDARACLSYLTIELKGHPPPEHRESVGSRVFGCDICQDVCPWNRRSPVSADPAWQPREWFEDAEIVKLFEMSDDEWRAATRGSTLKRAGVVGLRRALALALGSSTDPACREALVRVALGVRPDGSPSFDDEVVTEHIAWALEQWSARADIREPARSGNRTLRRRTEVE